MEMRAAYVMVGAIVMIILAAAFSFVLWIGSGQREYDEYDVIFNDRVTGLSTGSIVRFNGIQKGEVDTLSIDPFDPRIVVARVRVDKDTPITTDTRAELEPVGFTGLAIIQFVGGSADAPRLLDVSEERVPTINANTGGVNALLESSGDLFARANLILSDENIGNISETLAHINEVTGAIAENRDEISAIVKNAEQATADLSITLERLRNASAGLEALMTEDAPRTVKNADALVTDTRALVTELEMMIAENRESFEYFADQGLGQVAPALSEARSLMRSLNQLLHDIERDPKAFFLGEGTPEYEGED